MRRFAIFLIIVLCAAIVNAQLQFTATFEPAEKAIKTGEKATYKLTLKHNSKYEEKFDVYSPDLSWDVRTKDYLNVPPEGLTTEVYVRSLNENEGVFGVPVHITSSLTNQILQKNLVLVISPKSINAEYSPSVHGEVSLPAKIDPRQPFVITLELTNKNRKPLDQVEIKLRSSLINKDYSTSLSPNEQKKLVYTFTLLKDTKPQEDNLRTTIFVIEGEKTSRFDLQGVKFSIEEYGDVETTVGEEKGLLTKTKIVKLTNTGNIQRTGKFSESASSLGSLFTSTDPEVQRLSGKYAWSVDLTAGESKTINIYKNYWPLIIFLLIIAGSIATYSVLRSQLVVKKQARIVSTKEGGILEMKVLLNVKNRSQQSVNSVKILDLVPNLAVFQEEKQIGTISPASIKTLEKGTLLKWVIESLEPGEERIIQYKIRNKVAMLEGILLPVAVAKYSVKGITRSVKSNVCKV
ncbi:hypothetical protein HYV79_03295 [Candidatus Woesearchaeota archaeon]|nr:hypothetical protein [Candidatus Woesearchaeota archaeon]